MPKLDQVFRESLLSYLKNPHDAKNKKNLTNSAFAIYKDAITNCGTEPDKYWEHVDKIIKSAVQGIKVHPDIAKTLESFKRDLTLSDFAEEINAFCALNFAHDYLINPKKYCLKKIINDFLIAQDKLSKEENIVAKRHSAGSFFLSNSDVSNIRIKKSVIDHLLKSISEKIYSESSIESKDGPVFNDVGQHIQLIETHINTLSEEQCKQILSCFLQEINPILNAEDITNSEKRSALMVHSFNDKWFFTFLAMIVKTIQETLGITTSEEKLLKNSVNEAKDSGITFN